MCGRFGFFGDANDASELLGQSIGPVPKSRYNIAPSQKACVVHRKMGGMVLSALAFGLKRPGGGTVINARAETAHRLTMFKRLITHQRAIVLASGFYEWAQIGGAKQPFFFQRHDRAIFGLAALVDLAPEDCAPGFVILTTQANDCVGAIHPRMPVMLDQKGIALWLDDHSTPTMQKAVLVPFTVAPMRKRTVSRRVNSPIFDEPACIEEVTHTAIEQASAKKNVMAEPKAQKDLFVKES